MDPTEPQRPPEPVVIQPQNMPPPLPVPPPSDTDVVAAPPTSPVMIPVFPQQEVFQPDQYALADDGLVGAAKKSRFRLLVIAGVLLIGTALFIFLNGSNKLELTIYEGTNFLLEVPKEYEQKNFDSHTRFEERGGAAEDKSFVMIISEPYPVELNEDEKAKFIDEFKNQLPAFVGELTSNTGDKVENITTERILTEEKNAVRVKATFIGASTGKRANFEMITIFGYQGIYAAGVAVQDKDTNLAEVSRTILNSLTATD